MWRWLGCLWALPVAIPIWALYVLPFWALGWHRRERGSMTRFAARFRVTGRAPRWLLGRWQGWAGHAVAFAIILGPMAIEKRYVRHERRHIDQWLMLGPLFPVVYFARLVSVGYRDNELEEDARRHEGPRRG
ncbi:MAG TPA: hypothetical protein VLI71_05760 [Gammaproteobacteria bacterium]|nr:hypothetical protein [Gammaproteobacteria bacterium]